MTPETILFAAVVVAHGLAVRLLAAVRGSSDSWVVQRLIENQRGRRWITYQAPDSLLPGDKPYPSLVYFFISRFPRRWWPRLSTAVNIGSDLVLSLGLFWFAERSLVRAGLLPGDAAWSAFLVAATFSTTPILVPVNARLRATNGRPPGLVLATAYLLSVGTATWSTGLTAATWSVGAAALALAVALASQFGAQAIIVMTPVIAVGMASPWPLAALVLAGAVGWFIPSLGVRDLAYFKINHALWYLRNRHKQSVVEGRNLLWNTVRAPIEILRNPKRGRQLLFYHSPVWIAAYSLPLAWWLGSLALSSETFREDLADPQLRFATSCVAGSLVAFLLTSTGKLTIFGQAERYFEYATPWLGVMAVAAVAHAPEPSGRALALLAFLNVSIILFVQILCDEHNVRELTRGGRDLGERELARILSRQEGDVRVATVPIKLASLLSYHVRVHSTTGKKVRFYFRLILNLQRRLDRFSEFDADTEPDHIELFRGTPDELQRRYGVRWIVLSRVFGRSHGERSFVRALVQYPIVWENEHYVLYDLEEKPRDGGGFDDGVVQRGSDESTRAA